MKGNEFLLVRVSLGNKTAQVRDVIGQRSYCCIVNMLMTSYHVVQVFCM